MYLVCHYCCPFMDVFKMSAKLSLALLTPLSYTIGAILYIARIPSCNVNTTHSLSRGTHAAFMVELGTLWYYFVTIHKWSHKG